jgi:type IV pilus assembly protein PilA
VQVSETTGEITITYIADKVGVAATENEINIRPFVRAFKAGTAPLTLDAALAAGKTGAIDWGCASATKATATDGNMGDVTEGTMLAKYAPAACR